LKTYQPEYALIAHETRKEHRKELANMLAQIAMERAARLPPPAPSVSLEAQFRTTIQCIREDLQTAKEVQAGQVLRWLRN